MEASQVADVIIKRFIEKGKAQGSRNYFGYVDSYPVGIIVSREKGQNTKIPKSTLNEAIEAVRQKPSIYYDGPSALRPYITKRIQSPLWALLRLASLDELTS